jgi:hypothetical protein
MWFYNFVSKVVTIAKEDCQSYPNIRQDLPLLVAIELIRLHYKDIKTCSFSSYNFISHESRHRDFWTAEALEAFKSYRGDWYKFVKSRYTDILPGNVRPYISSAEPANVFSPFHIACQGLLAEFVTFCFSSVSDF